MLIQIYPSKKGIRVNQRKNINRETSVPKNINTNNSIITTKCTQQQWNKANPSLPLVSDAW